MCGAGLCGRHLSSKVVEGTTRSSPRGTRRSALNDELSTQLDVAVPPGTMSNPRVTVINQSARNRETMSRLRRDRLARPDDLAAAGLRQAVSREGLSADSAALLCHRRVSDPRRTCCGARLEPRRPAAGAGEWEPIARDSWPGRDTTTRSHSTGARFPVRRASCATPFSDPAGAAAPVASVRSVSRTASHRSTDGRRTRPAVRNTSALAHIRVACTHEQSGPRHLGISNDEALLSNAGVEGAFADGSIRAVRTPPRKRVGQDALWPHGIPANDHLARARSSATRTSRSP